MATLDPASEWRRLTEFYGRRCDDELLALFRKKSELTEAAQEALANEIRQRKLKPLPEETPAPARVALISAPPDSAALPSAYDEDRKLVEIRTVWSLADALQLQRLLDQAGIPFFMGPEKASGVDSVTSDFASGVGVQIMNVGVPWAQVALQNYEPANEPASDHEDENVEHPVRCPKCHSTEVIFDSLIGDQPRSEKDTPQQFEWTCDACGHRWTDDGVVKEP
jgi:DNA-directed RNA polymerase subunit M/transcription elongation factor TFIIS